MPTFTFNRCHYESCNRCHYESCSVSHGITHPYYPYTCMLQELYLPQQNWDVPLILRSKHHVLAPLMPDAMTIYYLGTAFRVILERAHSASVVKGSVCPLTDRSLCLPRVPTCTSRIHGGSVMCMGCRLRCTAYDVYMVHIRARCSMDPGFQLWELPQSQPALRSRPSASAISPICSGLAG